MKIVFLVDAFPTISETFILNQITGLMDLGHEVFIFSAARPEERDLHEDIRRYGLLKKTYYHNDRPRNWFARLALAMKLAFFLGWRNPRAVANSLNVFRYGRDALSLTYFYKVMLFLGIGAVDVIQCHYGPNGNLGARLKAMGIGGKLVVMFHGYDIRRGIEEGGMIYRPAFEQADRILSISEYSEKHLLAFGAPSEKIHYHPVGVDLKRYKQASPKAEAAKGRFRILTVSRLIEEKGLRYGLEAVHTLLRRGLDVCYDIVGDGPLRGELKDQVAALDMCDVVHFYGRQTQTSVIHLLQETQAFLLPSVAEALPVVLMEAQAMGVPVVATAVGSVYQIVADRESGYLVASEDVEAMADRLEALVRNPEQAAAMGRNGRRQIEGRYDIAELNRRLVELYEDLESDL